MFKAISKFILKLLGWKIEGRYPDEVKKEDTYCCSTYIELGFHSRYIG